MRFTIFQTGLFLLGFIFLNPTCLAVQTPQPVQTNQTSQPEEDPCSLQNPFKRSFPNLVLGRVTSTKIVERNKTTTRYTSEAVVTQVFTGKADLLEKKFEVTSFGGDIPLDSQSIHPQLQPDEIGIWLILSGSQDVFYSGWFEAFSREFPCRQNVHPEFEQVLELAQVISELSQTAPELQAQLLKSHAINPNQEVSLFAVSLLLDTHCPEHMEYLKQMFFEGKLPVLSQLYLDDRLGSFYSKQPSTAEQWRNQPERWTWIFQLSQHRFNPREARFYRSSCWNTIYPKPLNPSYFRGLVNRTARNTSLPFKDRQGIFHFAIQREVEERSLSGREAVDQYLWFIEQNVNQPGIDKTWSYLISFPLTQPQIDRMSQLVKMTTNPEALKQCNQVWEMYRNLLFHSKCLPGLK